MMTYFKLARFGNVVIAFISVEVSGILCGVNIARSPALLAAAIAASLVTAGGNAVNDLFDLDIDKINRPGRPLASGKLSPRQVTIFYIATTVAGLIISAAVNVWAFALAVAAAALVFFYSYRLKRTILLGNVVVALVTGLAFIYGGAVVKNIGDVYPAAVFAFLTNLIREIIKDAEDVRGDGKIGIRTIATRYGTKISARLSIILTFVLLFVAWGAYQINILPIQFLTVCGLTIFPIGIYITYLLITRSGFSEASFGYKLIMIFGLIALIVGKV